MKTVFFDDADRTFNFSQVQRSIFDQIPNVQIVASASTNVNISGADIFKERELLNPSIEHFVCKETDCTEKANLIKDIVDDAKGQIIIFCSVSKCIQIYEKKN